MDSNELKQFYNYLKKKEVFRSQAEFAESVGKSRQYVAEAMNGTVKLTPQIINSVKNKYSEEYAEFIAAKGSADGRSQVPKKKIPLFDDVGSIGGINSTIAVDHGVVYPSELIDPGELFPGASAAIRHYSDSMVEYPSGCILFIQIIEPPYSFIWGEDYVVEYNGYRITKRLQRGKDEKHVRAYSTNTDTYPDGTPVHQPIDIAVAEIRHLYLVIGHIRKKYGSGLLRAAQ